MSGQRIDWRAIPDRYRRWQALPLWRKALWLVWRTVSIGVLYVVCAVGILWYNEPTLLGAIWTGSESPWALVWLFAASPELLLLCAILLPAIAAAVLLPHRPDWS